NRFSRSLQRIRTTPYWQSGPCSNEEPEKAMAWPRSRRSGEHNRERSRILWYSDGFRFAQGEEEKMATGFDNPVGFIGIGTMGGMLIDAFLRAGTFRPEQVFIHNRTPQKAHMMAQKYP